MKKRLSATPLLCLPLVLIVAAGALPNCVSDAIKPGRAEAPARILGLQRRQRIDVAGKGSTIFVSPTGTPAGNGTRKHPWDLQTALSQPPRVQPGMTIYLRGGTYAGKFISNLTGTAAAPITIASYPGEWAILDGHKTSTLITSISSTSTSLSFAGSSGLSAGAVVWLDGEVILMRNKTADGFSSCVRGWNGTVAAAHSSGAVAIALGSVLMINGAYAVYRDFEVMSSDTSRIFAGDSVNGTQPVRGDGLTVFGHDTHLINLVVHDNLDGIGFWESAIDSEIYGCVIFNNGIIDAIRGHGHGLYIQNQAGTKRIVDVISFNNFATGMKGYSQASYANGLYFEGVCSFNNGSTSSFDGNPLGDSSTHRYSNLFVGTTTYPLDGITVVNCYLYHPQGVSPEFGNAYFGYQTVGNTNLTLQDNYVMGGGVALAVQGWQNAVATGNTLYAGQSPGDGVMASVQAAASQNFTWDNNIYYDTTATQDGVSYSFTFDNQPNRFGNLRLPFDDSGTALGKGWRQWSGFDANSSYRQSHPVGMNLFVRPNRYDPTRATIVIFNWDKLGRVKVDLGSLATLNTEYEIIDVQDYFGAPIASGVYTGNQVWLPLTDSRVAAPIGATVAPDSTAPEFKVFEVFIRPGS